MDGRKQGQPASSYFGPTRTRAHPACRPARRATPFLGSPLPRQDSACKQRPGEPQDAGRAFRVPLCLTSAHVSCRFFNTPPCLPPAPPLHPHTASGRLGSLLWPPEPWHPLCWGVTPQGQPTVSPGWTGGWSGAPAPSPLIWGLQNPICGVVGLRPRVLPGCCPESFPGSRGHLHPWLPAAFPCRASSRPSASPVPMSLSAPRLPPPVSAWKRPRASRGSCNGMGPSS